MAAGTWLGLASGAADAGPCSGQIAELGHRLAQLSPLGTGMTGQPVDATPGNARPGASSATGTAAGDRGGTGQATAVPGTIAPSPTDVRAQRQGNPTAARAAAGDAPGGPVLQAKAELEQAVLLDRKNDPSCAASVARVRRLMGG